MLDPLSQWQSGDITAFEALFRQYERLVLKNAYLITGSREEAEDIVQEVFMAVWRARRTYNPEKGRLTTWLHKITVNACLEKRRKKKTTIVPFENVGSPDIAEHLSDPAIETPNNYDELIAAMNSLDKKHRAVLVMRYFNELSYEEIARSLDIPLGTVKSRIYQSLKYLREQMTGLKG
jgi:RNA polymerase sigma factor (sigma-70 family)